MNKELLNITTVTEYNDMLGVETLHPLVSVIDLSKAKPMKRMKQRFQLLCRIPERREELRVGFTDASVTIIRKALSVRLAPPDR